MTIAEALQSANASLREAGVPEAQLVAQSLLTEALKCDRTYLIINFSRQLTTEEQENFAELLARRAAGEPLQYITGRQEFFGLEFEVTPDVLIPRPETELIVEEVIRLAADRDAPFIVDVGTGSGCLAVALARELPAARLVATDISFAAASVARRNARRHGLGERISLLVADLLATFPTAPFADFIVSNPPYVAARELPTLQREVRDWEPRVALTDFGDGLSNYRRLFSEAPSRLKSGGYLLCEMGFTQAETISRMVDEANWKEPRLLADLQKIPRTLVLERR